MPDSELVFLVSFPDPMEAEVAKSALESAGMECLIQADTAGGMRPHMAVGTGGYRLVVRAEDLQAAREALNLRAT